LVEALQGQVVLAPLTRGGRRPFRRLVSEMGAKVTYGEMAYAAKCVEGDVLELDKLSPFEGEQCFVAQLACSPKEMGAGVRAGLIAAEAGAQWVDLNCGCPIHAAVSRGYGVALMRSGRDLVQLTKGMARRLPVPLTLKLRLGEEEVEEEALAELLGRLQAAGAAAVTVHGRTGAQRYTGAADWEVIARSAAANPGLAVVGNGDVLTLADCNNTLAMPGLAAVMTGRGALIRPWLFKELQEGVEWLPTPEERLGVYMRFVELVAEEEGMAWAAEDPPVPYIAWHFSFFSRYRPFPRERFVGSTVGDPAAEPLIIAQAADPAPFATWEGEHAKGFLERLLRCQCDAANLGIAACLWECRRAGGGHEDDGGPNEPGTGPGVARAMQALEALAGEHLDGWEAQAATRTVVFDRK